MNEKVRDMPTDGVIDLFTPIVNVFVHVTSAQWVEGRGGEPKRQYSGCMR